MELSSPLAVEQLRGRGALPFQRPATTRSFAGEGAGADSAHLQRAATSRRRRQGETRRTHRQKDKKALTDTVPCDVSESKY